MRSRMAVAVGASALVATTLAGLAGSPAQADDLYTENFDSLTGQLQPRADETGVPADVLGWTHAAPEGWTVDTDAATADKGVQEWRGWSFTTTEFWSKAAPGQGRENFTKGTDVIAVADSDEWDDKNTPTEQPFNSTLTSPAYDVSGKSTVHVNFDSSYRQTGPQVGALEVSFDGAAPERLFEYTTATLGDQVYLENRTLTQPVEVPAGATSMKVSWVIEEAVNDWYWAVDNIAISDQADPDGESPIPDKPEPGDVPDGISDKKVLFIDFDGVRFDKLVAADTPNLDALAAEGQFGKSYIQDGALAGTNSGPGHSNLLTGTWPDKHKVLDNGFGGNNIAQYPDYMTRLEQVNPGFSTFSTLDWAPLNTYLINKPDVKLQQAGPDTKTTDKQSTDDAIEVLSTRNPDSMYVYMHDGDNMGHTYGADSQEYADAMPILDQRVGELVAAVKARATYAQEDWLIVAGTDHGMYDKGHGGNQHVTREIWTLASGGDVPKTGTATRQWRQVDLVPTIFRHLGVDVDPAWGLDGVPIGTASRDPFDTVAKSLKGVVDEPAKPAGVGGWTKVKPKSWTIAEKTPRNTGAAEYRGWSFMSGEFWTTSEEGQGRGSFVRGQDTIAVADADEWNDKGNPVITGARFDSTLYSPWVRIPGGAKVDVSFFSHYKQEQVPENPQRAEVVAEFGDGTTKVLWSANAQQGAEFDISKLVELNALAPGSATKVRIGWRMVAADNGYWAIDAPMISTQR